MHASNQPRSLVFARARGTGRGQQITSRWLMPPGQLLPLIKLGGSPPRYRLAFVIKTSQPKLRPVWFTPFVSSSDFLLLLSLEPVVSWLRKVAVVSIIGRSYQSTLWSPRISANLLYSQRNVKLGVYLINEKENLLFIFLNFIFRFFFVAKEIISLLLKLK